MAEVSIAADEQSGLPRFGCFTPTLEEIEPNAGPEGAALAAFKSDIESTINGAVEIDLHFGASLGDPASSLENMMAGDFDLLSGDTRYFLPLMIDEVTGFDLPFMLPDNDVARKYVATPMFVQMAVRIRA